MKVTLHKSSDGVLHETYAEFAAAEARLKMKPLLTALVDAETKSYDEGGVFQADDRGEPVLYVDDVVEFIAANADAIRTILNDATVVRRGRKPAEVK
jgi:hypothetical protein